MELENQGGSGAVMSHWDKRLLGVRCSVSKTNCSLFIPTLMQNELMTGGDANGAKLSILTLALLQDTGLATILIMQSSDTFSFSLIAAIDGTRWTTVRQSSLTGGEMLAASLFLTVVEVT